MKVFLVPNLNKELAYDAAAKAVEALISHGADVLLDEKTRTALSFEAVHYCNVNDALKNCDAIVTIGGDGTLLHIADKSAGKPLLGINVGRLGFLATVEFDEISSKLARLAKGEYTIDRRSMLDITILGKEKKCLHALNDIIISKPNISNTIDVDIYCDGIPVNSFRGDGVIVATPTGSTAYSLSAGGPVLDARIEGILVTPVCAHGLHNPPMVFSANRKLRITVSAYDCIDAQFSIDGKDGQSIECGETVAISLASEYMTLVCFNEADQFEAIDKKLKGR